MMMSRLEHVDRIHGRIVKGGGGCFLVSNYPCLHSLLCWLGQDPSSSDFRIRIKSQCKVKCLFCWASVGCELWSDG